MKLFRLLLPFTILFANNVFSQTLEEQEKQIAARNHIKSKTQIDFKFTNGKQTITGVKSSTTIYAPTGDILQVNYLDSKGQVMGGEKYSYDEHGNRTLFEREGSGSKYKKVSEYTAQNDVLLETGFNGAENFRNEFTYSSGKISSAVYMLNGKIDQKLVYTYTGSTSNVGVYSGGVTLSSKIKMIYDVSGNLIEEAHYSLDGRETERKNFRYNAASKLIEEAKTQGGKLFYKITQEYDAKSRLIKVSEETLAKAKYIKKTYVFDANGNLLDYKWRRNPNEEFNVKTYTYNPQGICLTEHTFYPGTKFELLSKFEYEYY